MSKPLVSIIIPVFNGSDFLKESIESALNQTYSNTEVIVVNDGSTDGGETERIALSYGDKIKYFKKENGGVSSALNLGIEKMKGDWFSWLSHDDLYLPQKIESQIYKIGEKQLNPNETIISCESNLIDSKGGKIRKVKRKDYGFFSGERMFEILFKDKSLNGCCLLIPKESLLKIGGFETNYRFIQDWVCWVMLSLKGSNFFIYNQVLVKSRVHEKQQTKKIRDLKPKETNDFLELLLVKIKNKKANKKDYLKPVLFYTMQLEDSEIRKKYFRELKKEQNDLKGAMFNKIDLFWYFLRGKGIATAKKIYRKYINFRFRNPRRDSDQ